MQTLTTSFNRAAAREAETQFWLLMWIWFVFIDEDFRRRAEERQRRQLESQQPQKRPEPYCPWCNGQCRTCGRCNCRKHKPCFCKRRPPAPRPF